MWPGHVPSDCANRFGSRASATVVIRLRLAADDISRAQAGLWQTPQPRRARRPAPMRTPPLCRAARREVAQRPRQARIGSRQAEPQFGHRVLLAAGAHDVGPLVRPMMQVFCASRSSCLCGSGLGTDPARPAMRTAGWRADLFYRHPPKVLPVHAYADPASKIAQGNGESFFAVCVPRRSCPSFRTFRDGSKG